MITGEQVKTARNLLGWSQLKLAMKIKTQLNDTAVGEVENEQRRCHRKILCW
jgi:ribosome-binding protein aMBF1 (putative translation factor)